MNSRISMFLLGATLALGFTVASYLLSNAIKSMRQDTGIKVKGYAEVQVKADTATWKINISSRDPDVKLAYSKVESDRNTVLAKLAELNIMGSETKIGSASIFEEKEVDEKGNKKNKIEFYKVSQEISVETNKVDQVYNIQKEVSGLIKIGIDVDSKMPSFTYSKIEEAKLELLGKASQNAYDRALIIISKTGGKIGALKSATQGVFQIVPKNSTDVSDYGSYDVTTIEKTVKAVVTLDFEVAK